MGYAVASGSFEISTPLLLMTAASLCAYHGGMVMNDAVDAERDAADRRGRPIGEGSVSVGVAWMLAYALLVGCVLIAMIAAARADSMGHVVLAVVLTCAIAAYNSRYKATIAGPLLMGLCRFLNVQLGSFAADEVCAVPGLIKSSTPPGIQEAWLASAMIGIYVVGLTLFARDEANQSKRGLLIVGTVISAASLSIFGYGGWPPATMQPGTWYLIWAIVALIATRGMFAAILQPTPRNIGRGVGIAIQGLVVIDAVLAAVYAGPVAGLAILALLPVTMLLARWIPQT